MMAGLISINKPHTDNIFSGDKSLDWRRKPLPEDLYYVYETKNKGGCGMVIGEMYITGSKGIDTSGPLEVGLINAGCVHPVALKKYANNGIVYANFIKDAKRYDEPKMLSKFSVIDKDAIKKCPNRERAFSNPVLCNGAMLPAGYVCMKGEVDWCVKCKPKPVVRPPQNWCHVEELNNG